MTRFSAAAAPAATPLPMQWNSDGGGGGYDGPLSFDGRLESFDGIGTLAHPAPPPSLRAWRRRSRGIYVTVRCGFALILLTVLIAAVVGLMFNFIVTRTRWTEAQEGVSWPAPGKAASYASLSGATNGGAVANEWVNSTHEVSTAEGSHASEGDEDNFPNEEFARRQREALEFRLPSDLVPQYYAVELKPNIYEADPRQFELNGTVKIRFSCATSTNLIVLHMAYGMSVIDYSLRPADGSGAPKITTYTFNQFSCLLKFNLTAPLTVGRNYTIAIVFRTALRDDDFGLFYRTYRASDGSKRYLVASQLQPVDARKVFPCFDEPALKAVFAMTVWRKRGMTALSNMPIKESVPSAGDWIIDRFHDTPPMSTYIVAVIICDYEFSSTSAGARNSIVRAWAPKHLLPRTAYALEVAANITNYFEILLDEEFILPKQDMIFVPRLQFYAMENWGLITYNTEAFFFHPISSVAREKMLVSQVVAHEIAHQWFGNLVTPYWWDDIWLSEGITTYMQFVGMGYVEPDWDADLLSLPEVVFSSKQADSHMTTQPLRQRAESLPEIHSVFSTIVYKKGASIVRQARFILGDNAFFEGLRKYIKKHKHGTAQEHDLLDAWQQEATRSGLSYNFSEVMKSWTHQLGYPVISLTYKDKMVHQARQEIFWNRKAFNISALPESSYHYKWYVPLTIVTDKQRNVNTSHHDVIWMSPEDEAKNLRTDYDSWFIVNVGSYGFYRVNYENVMWDAIAQQLQSNHEVIHASNRAQLIDDAFHLSRCGYLAIEKALAVTKYIKKESNYVVLDVALKELGHIGDQLRTRISYGTFSNYMKSLLTEPYRRLGQLSRGYTSDFNHPSSDIAQRISKIVLASACLYDADECRTAAKSLFDEWMKNKTALPLHARAVAYCYGVKLGGVAEWDYVYAQYSVTLDDDTDRGHLLNALSCTAEPWLISRLLNYSLDESKFSKDAAPIIFKQVSSTAIGKFLAWEFIRKNWLTFFIERYRFDSYLTAVLLEVMMTFTTEQELKEVTELGNLQDEMLGQRLHGFTWAEADIQKTVDFLNENEARIVGWLQAS